MEIKDIRNIDYRSLCRWGWRALAGCRRRIAAITLLGLLRVAASLGFVWVSKMLIDAATSPASTESSLWWLSGILIGVMLAEAALSQASNYVSSITSVHLSNTLLHRLYTAVLSSDVYTDRKHSGDILNRLTLDIKTFVDTVVKTLPSIVVMLFQLAAAFWLLCEMNITLALCALIITPIAILTSKAYLRRMRRINREIRSHESDIHTSVQEGVQHRMVVQTLECSPVMSERLGQHQSRLMGSTVSRARLSLFSRSVVRLGFLSGYLIAFVWSVFSLHAGVITYGMMVAFLQLVNRIQIPISSLSSTLPNIVGTSTAIERLMEIDTVSAPSPGDEGTALRSPLGVRLTDVTFSYPALPGEKEQDVILSGFSYDFQPGSKTVIMGRTGVGKSTLTKLILALIRPDSGSVAIYDSGGASHIAGPSTRRHIVYVPQGNTLLEGSIRDNLLLGDPCADDDRLREVLTIAAADFVFNLPDGLDTRCGELGSALSEGQCQRIAIARALLREGSILILDEFNSSLDLDTASALMERLIASRPDATIIFISHRPEVADAAGADILRLTRS